MPEQAVTIRVWDLPTRLFHWTLATCVVGSVVSAKIGGDALVWHFRLGYTVFALLIFRLVWGLVGGRWSRFVSFLFSPTALWRHLRGRPADGERLDVGHSPLGALSVFALLLLLVAQVATGLVADDEIATVGPLNRYVDTALGLAATGWHKSWGQWLILGMVGLHLAAVARYVAAGSDILAAMLGGDKTLPPGTPASADGPRQRWLALALVLACAAIVTGVVSLGG